MSICAIGPNRDPSWIRTDSITHLYVAFASIEPSTYEVVPMEGTSTDIFTKIMALKESAPGLKIFLSLGGWTYSDNGTLVVPSVMFGPRCCLNKLV
jgi:chitinase